MPSPLASPLWRNHAFVRVWAAATISIFGSLITRMALPFVAILVLQAGPIEVAVLRGLDLGAALLVGLVAGAWVDRLRRRPVLIWADLGRAALLATIPIAFAAGVLTYWQLLVVAALGAVLTVFFDAADNAYLPTVVERDRLVEANSALAASGSAAEMVSFGITGFLVQVLTAPIAIVADAVSFVASALLLGSIRHGEAPPPRREDREPVLSEIRAGLRLVARDPVLRAFAGARMALAATWGVFGATWLLYATNDLALAPAAIGVIAGVGGLASFAGAVAAARSTRRWGIGTVAVAAMALSAIGHAFIPLAPAGAPLIAVAFLLGQQLVADSAVTVFEVTETSIRQARVRDRELGRVSATFRAAGGLAQLVATIGAGLLAEVVGLRLTTIVGPLVALAAAAILWRSPVRLVRTVLGPDERSVAQAVVDVGRDEPIGG